MLYNKNGPSIAAGADKFRIALITHQGNALVLGNENDVALDGFGGGLEGRGGCGGESLRAAGALKPHLRPVVKPNIIMPYTLEKRQCTNHRGHV